MSPADQQLLDAFTDHLWLEDGLARNTLDSYRRDLQQYGDWLGQRGKCMGEAIEQDVQQYLAVKFPQSKPHSVSRLLASLRRFYRYCLREHEIESDPTLRIDSPKLPRSLPKSLSEAQCSALLPDDLLHLRAMDR